MKRFATEVTKIGRVVPQLIVRYGLHQRQNIEAAEAAWNAAVGEPFASLSKVSKIQRGTLEISVPHTALIQELLFRKTELLQSVQLSVPEENIKRIKFVSG